MCRSSQCNTQINLACAIRLAVGTQSAMIDKIAMAHRNRRIAAHNS